MSASDEAVRNAQFNAALEAQNTEQLRQRPHVIMRPRIFPDGNMWCALYGADLQMGVAGFGKSPAEACEAFDVAWATAMPQKPAVLLDPARNN